MAGVSSFGIYPGLWVRRATIPPTAAEHTFFMRGRGYGAIQHHSKTLVAIFCIGLEGIIAAPLLSGVGIFGVGLRTNYRARQQYRRNNEALHRKFSI